MNKLGIMQGRLTNKNGFYPQQFPWENWKEEFALCQRIGIETIEWMFNSEKYSSNPIYIDDKSDCLKQILKDEKVSVDSICANYFMQNSLFDNELNKRKSNIDVFLKLLDIAAQLNISCIVLPLFESNCPRTKEEEQQLLSILHHILLTSSNTQTYIAIESDWQPKKLITFIENNNQTRLKVCYDLGNAVGMNRNILEEMDILKRYIIHIHIKDKNKSGTSVLLGEGEVDFAHCFRLLQKIHYHGNYIMESYFGVNAVEDTKQNYFYIKDIKSNILEK